MTAVIAFTFFVRPRPIWDDFLGQPTKSKTSLQKNMSRLQKIGASTNGGAGAEPFDKLRYALLNSDLGCIAKLAG